MLKFTGILIQNTKNSSNFYNYIRIYYSTVNTAEFKNLAFEAGKSSSNANSVDSSKNLSFRNSMVAAAFESLQNENRKEPQTTSNISSVKTVNELLSLPEGNTISRKYALRIISTLADWSLNGKVKLLDFEADPRFIRLCKVLTKTNPKYNKNSARSEDLATILNITADDEAAKLVASITLPQMVKVMSTLTQKRRRSTILLRALSFNITRSSDLLNLKLCSDVLYSMAVLNFPDENLLHRVCTDVYKGINDDFQKSSVLGSILTSLGLLKYKDIGVLEASCQWIMKYTEICRPQDLFALFLTMAVLNYEPPNTDAFFEKLIPQLNVADAVKPIVWLDLVWSLVLLNRAPSEMISLVLSKEFINKINTEKEQNIAVKLKLINIESAVKHLMTNYTGPTLEDLSEIRNIELLRSKQKEGMSASITECLKNLMSDKHIKTKVNTHMGFYIDAECYFDNKCNPILPMNFNKTPEQKKIAILALDYHDMCKGSIEPTGIVSLARKLLIAHGYRVLTIPYTEYRPTDKLVDRVQYLECQLKNIVQTDKRP